MSEHSQEIKKKARSHIVKALELAHFMDEKQGDYPEQQDKYKKEIGEAKKLLRKVYPPNDVIFKELDMETNLGLNTALGGLGLGDEPFVDMKKPAPEGFGAETFDSEMGNLLVEYVETIHPDSEMQQEELMDLLVSGEYEVPLAEMKMVVERPSMAQPPMREMAMATETFNADSKEEARLKKYEKTYGKEGAKVRNRIFKRILANAQDGTKAGQWSARKAQSLTEEYEKAMKGKGKRAYKTSKRTKTQKSLKRWGDKKWRTKSGQKSSKTGERYLPEKAIKALTDEEYKKTSAKKRKDTKKGKQFSDQPKSIAKKVAKYRAESYNPESADFDPYADSEVGEYGKRLLDQALIQVFEWFNMRYGYAKEDRDFIERYGLHRYGKDHKILARSFTTGIYGEEGDFKIKEEDEYDGSTYYFPDGATQRQLEEIARQFRITHAVPTFKLEWDVNDKPYKYGITIIATVAEKDIVNQLEMYDDNQNWRDLHPRLILPPDLWSAESKPYSVDVNRSTNKEKKLMAVFEDKEGKKIKTTHFGARGMSDYTKHGDKERMERYNKRHKKNENWNDPMTAGSLSKHILWNKPSLAGSFNHFKRKFGLKGSLNVSRSAESFNAQSTFPRWNRPSEFSIHPELEYNYGRDYPSHFMLTLYYVWELGQHPSLTIYNNYGRDTKKLAIPDDKVQQYLLDIEVPHPYVFNDYKMGAYYRRSKKQNQYIGLSLRERIVEKDWKYGAWKYATATEETWQRIAQMMGFDKSVVVGDGNRRMMGVDFKIPATDYDSIWRDIVRMSRNRDHVFHSKLMKRWNKELGDFRTSKLKDEYSGWHKEYPFYVGATTYRGESYGAEGYSPEMEKARQMKNRYIPPNFKVERKDGRKYLFLDFDNTVRHTIPDPKPDEPARRRPPHKAEEVVLIDGVKERVHEWADAGYFVVGLTNQSNIESGFNTTQDVVDAIKRTLDLLDMQFPVYFASHKNKDLPDFNYRKPMTGMIDAAFRDFGSPNHTYSLMVGDDWEGADSGMAENAGVHFIGVLPFIENSLPQGEQVMFVYTKAGELVSILNPDDLIPTFAEEYDRKMNTFASESSYSKSTTSLAGNTMKMTMGTIVGVVGALILGYNAPAIYNRYMKKDESAAEGSVDSEQSLANQGFMEDWVGGNEGDDNLVSAGNEPTPPMISYSYNPLASTDAMSYDPATRPPSMI